MYIIFAGRWPELVPIIYEDKCLILGLQVNMNNHISLAICSNIAKLQRNRRQITTLPKNVIRNNIALSTRWITSRKLYHNCLAIQIDGHKVSWMEQAIIPMPN